MKATTFTAHGAPITQGSMVVMRGRLVHVHSAALKAWRAEVGAAAQEAGITPADGAVALIMNFYLPLGKTVKRLRPTVKPDVDKLARAVMDALTGIAYTDDSQVTALAATKDYGKPSVVVTVTRLEER